MSNSIMQAVADMDNKEWNHVIRQNAYLPLASDQKMITSNKKESQRCQMLATGKLLPDNELWQGCVQDPSNYTTRSILGDWLQEHVDHDFGKYVVNGANKQLSGYDKSMFHIHNYWWFGGINDASNCNALFLIDVKRGLPSVLNLAINQRPSIIFRGSWPAYHNDMYAVDDVTLAINLSNVETYFNKVVSLFPIVRIELGCCTIFPHLGIMVWRHYNEQDIHYYKRAGYTLVKWWRCLNGLLHQPVRHIQGNRLYENLLRGHGDLRISQCARTVTIRDRRRSSKYRRSMVDTVPGNYTITPRHDGIEVRGVQ